MRPKPCRKCGHVEHPTYAIGRFKPNGPTGFLGATRRLHATRDDAEAEVCAANRYRAAALDPEATP